MRSSLTVLVGDSLLAVLVSALRLAREGACDMVPVDFENAFLAENLMQWDQVKASTVAFAVLTQTPAVFRYLEWAQISVSFRD